MKIDQEELREVISQAFTDAMDPTRTSTHNPASTVVDFVTFRVGEYLYSMGQERESSEVDAYHAGLSTPEPKTQGGLAGQEVRLFELAKHVMAGKSLDYNRSRLGEGGFRLDDARREYFPFGARSYVQMIATKAKRLVSLASADGPPNFEGMEDTIVDLACYGAMFFSYLVETPDAER